MFINNRCPISGKARKESFVVTISEIVFLANSISPVSSYIKDFILSKSSRALGA